MSGMGSIGEEGKQEEEEIEKEEGRKLILSNKYYKILYVLLPSNSSLIGLKLTIIEQMNLELSPHDIMTLQAYPIATFRYLSYVP